MAAKQREEEEGEQAKNNLAGYHVLVVLKEKFARLRVTILNVTCHVQVDLSTNLELGIHLENFCRCRELVVPPSTTRYKVKLRVYDSKNRLLELIVRIYTHRGGALRVSTTCSSQLYSCYIFRPDCSVVQLLHFQLCSCYIFRPECSVIQLLHF